LDQNQYINNFSEIILAGVGGMISYFLKYYKEKEMDMNYKFSFILFLINMIIGGFVGYIVGELVLDESKYHDFIIGMSGIASYPLLLILEGKFLFLIKQYLNMKSASVLGKDNNTKQFDDMAEDIIKYATGPGNCTPTKINPEITIKRQPPRENRMEPDKIDQEGTNQKFDNLFM
jgi:hypothetical protein